MISVLYTVACDICHWWDERTSSTVSKADALRRAKIEGWQTRVTPGQTGNQARHICPVCSGKITVPERDLDRRVVAP